MVSEAAKAAWGNDPPVTNSDLQILVAYFHDASGGNVDNDNMIKSIQDALIGLIYVDDRQITDTRIVRRPIAGLQLLGPSGDVSTAIVAGQDFTFVRVCGRVEEVDLS